MDFHFFHRDLTSRTCVFFKHDLEFQFRVLETEWRNRERIKGVSWNNSKYVKQREEFSKRIYVSLWKLANKTIDFWLHLDERENLCVQLGGRVVCQLVRGIPCRNSWVSSRPTKLVVKGERGCVHEQTVCILGHFKNLEWTFFLKLRDRHKLALRKMFAPVSSF